MVEKLKDMKIGQAMIVKRDDKDNGVFDKSIKLGDFFIEVRLDKDSWQECPLTKESQKLLKNIGGTK
jgi:hypothetical protein